MLLGQGDVPSPLPSWLDTVLDVAVGPVLTTAADIVRNAIGSGSSPPDSTEDPQAAWEDVGPASTTGAAGARASRGAASGFPGEYPEEASPGASTSPWPWMIGLGVLGVGGYVVYRLVGRSKRRR